MTEDFRVPDGMVGLSEYMQIHQLNHTNNACVVVLTHVQSKISMSLLFFIKSSAGGANRLTKYNRILAAKYRLLMVSYVLPPYLLNQQSMKGFPAAFGLTHFHINSDSAGLPERSVSLTGSADAIQ